MVISYQQLGYCRNCCCSKNKNSKNVSCIVISLLKYLNLRNVCMRKLSKIVLLLVALCLPCVQATDELYLVVGSNRIEGEISNPYLESYRYNSETDFSHQDTFDGKATTLDLYPDVGVPNHIPATDACAYVPSKPIAEVFMENFPSWGARDVMNLQRLNVTMHPELSVEIHKEFQKQTSMCPPIVQAIIQTRMFIDLNTPCTIDPLLMPRAIKNLRKHMRSGAKLYIEHMPLFSLPAEKKGKNPFSLYVYPLFPDLLKAVTVTDAEQVWYDAGERLYRLDIPLESIRSIILEGKEKQELCKKAIELVQVAMANATGKFYFERNTYFEQLNKEINSFSTNFLGKQAQFQQSLSVVIALELERLEQSRADSSINQFLQSQGFTNIQQERVDRNPFNGRSNSWMITAIKA